MLEFRSKPKEIIDFTVDGELFHIAPIAAFTFLDFAQIMADEGKVTYPSPQEKLQAEAGQSLIVRDMFRDHMAPEEWQRFDKFCRGPNAPDLQMLIEMVDGIIEASSVRPTLPPSPSEPGRSDTGDTSTASASSTESTSEPSPSPAP